MANGQSLENANRAIDVLVKVARFVKPVQHVTGKIEMTVSRFNISKLASITNGMDIKTEVSRIPGLKRYNMNPWSMSATIYYDPEILSPDIWNDFTSIEKTPGAEHDFRQKLLFVLEKHNGG
jgi:hypothetical protein